MNGYRVGLLLLSLLLLSGCAGKAHRESAVEGRSFRIQDLVKSDVDLVTEVQLRLVIASLKQLTDKLYRRNPRELLKGRGATREAALGRIFAADGGNGFPELDGKRAVESIRLAFDEDYSGDRVLALMVGLKSMVLRAYDGKQSFYLTDELDPQKLYNVARNIEIAVWMLSHNRDSRGELFIISNETNGEVDNLSYERLFGKLIALQDSSALIIAESSNRQIKTVIQTVASMVFLPI
ncbi:MAG: hypothetical protein RPU52_04360 [Candidatus Sedimenticola sp. (ex Thyasira tokunagai)]